jgi:hypothetical protein
VIAETDDDRWVRAQSVLVRVPTESTQRLLRGAGRRRLLLVVSIGLAVPALALFTVLVLRPDSFGEHVHVPTWRAAVGFSVAGLGLVLMVVTTVVQFRAMRPLNAWRGPMNVLTRAQRKELLRQVRGRAPVPPGRVPLARHLAELLLLQRFAVLPQVGLMVSFLGQWIADPTDFRLWFTAFFALALVVFGFLFRRESVRMRRFLATKPAPNPAVGPDDE